MFFYFLVVLDFFLFILIINTFPLLGFSRNNRQAQTGLAEGYSLDYQCYRPHGHGLSSARLRNQWTSPLAYRNRFLTLGQQAPLEGVTRLVQENLFLMRF